MNKASFPLFIVLLAVVFSSPLHAGVTVVGIQTNHGEITIELHDDDAPVTVENFLGYVNSNFYDGLLFHRVREDFMIQAGVYDEDLYGQDFNDNGLNLYDPCFYHTPGDPIELEASTDRKNLRGTIAMARTSDPNSATSQFFINHVDNPHLDPASGTDGYAVFGKVSRGMDVVDAIAGVDIFEEPNVVRYLEALPLEPVLIQSTSVIHQFDPNSSDFSDTDFLKAADGTTRTFVGQGAFSSQKHHREFTTITYLGIEALQWKQLADSVDAIDSFTIIMAKDTSGAIWILKYIFNEGSDNEIVLINAGSLIEAVSFSEFTDEDMYFRLIAGQYNSDDLDDPCNVITIGSGDDAVTERITSFSAAVENLPWYQSELILVKRQSQQTPEVIDWIYYHESVGPVFELYGTSEQPGDPNFFDPCQSGPIDLDRDGRRLGWAGRSEPAFLPDSDDFSDVSYIHAAPGQIRLYRGQATLDGASYNILFSREEMLQTNCLKIDDQAVEQWSKDSSVIYAARDSGNGLWLFRIDRDGDTVFAAETIDRIVPFGTWPDMYLRLMSGEFDQQSTVTTGTGESLETAEIFGLTESLPAWPDYNDELVLVKRSYGQYELDIDWSYYHESAGLMLNLSDDFDEPNMIDPNSNGWLLAEPDSMEEASFLMWAGSDRSNPADGFIVSGNFTAQRQDFDCDELFLRLGPCQTAISISNPLLGWRSGYEIFIDTPQSGGRFVAIVDLNKGTFRIIATGVDLSGLDEPIVLEMIVGNYFASGIAQINGGLKPPVILLRGYKDILRKSRFTFIYDNVIRNDSVSVVGEIVTQQHPIDLTQTEVTIGWGTDEFSVSAGRFIRLGSSDVYYYSNPWGELTLAYFNWVNNTFQVLIRKSLIAHPPQDLSVKFEHDGTVVFDEKITIN